MTDEDERILDDDIPYRLAHIDGLRWACEILIAGPDHRGRLEVLYSGQRVVAGTPRCVTNPLIEIGAISCRVMLEFLGIRLEGNDLVEVRGRRPDDVAIELLGVAPVTLADLDAYSGPDRDSVRLSCVTTINIAHKAVAHFTSAPIDRTGFEHLLRCGRTVIDLVEQRLYTKLGREVPDYCLWPTTARPTPLDQ